MPYGAHTPPTNRITVKLKIEFSTDSAAFNPWLDEIDSVLAVVFKQLESGKVSAPIRDTNGNTIGQWSWE